MVLAFVSPLPLSSAPSSLTPLVSRTPARLYTPSRTRPSFATPTCNASSSDSLSNAVVYALLQKFHGLDVSRVVKSFTDAMSDETLDVDAGTPTHQHATSFVADLPTSPFHDIGASNSTYAWVHYLESHWTEIRDELDAVTKRGDLENRGNNVWVPPVIEAATTYGPDWRTLVLQDREWDGVNTKIFPRTTQLLQQTDVPVPSVEAFFARQAPNTGIKLHTDYCNFILTMHLGLSVPPDEKSWIQVADQRRPWQNGKAMVFDTSFYHQTMNEDTELQRTVLLIRFWHPALTIHEQNAFKFLFQMLEDPENHPDVINAKNALTKPAPAPKRKAKPAKKAGSTSSSRGFGK